MAIYDVNPTDLVLKTAEKLKDIKEIQPPEWATFAKTGHGRDRPPVQEDWWFIRGASILRKIMIKGPVGVSKLRIAYGNRKNMGMAPEHFVVASGNIIRKLLQQLEKAGLAKQTEKGVHKGRVLTPKGVSFLDKTAVEILKENPPQKIQIPDEMIIIKEKKVEPQEQPKPKRTFEKKGRPKPRRDSPERERSPRKSNKRK